MPSYDRTANIPPLVDTFPELAGMTSEEVQVFFNAKTGLSIGSEMDNGSAFDRWRQALAQNGYPHLWKHNPRNLSRINALIVKNIAAAQAHAASPAPGLVPPPAPGAEPK